LCVSFNMGCEGSASIAKKMLVAKPRSISPTFFIPTLFDPGKYYVPRL
jgi:hypothetical protein